jgi:hypothetical protein
VLLLMGGAVAITFNRVSSERRTGGDQRAQLGAFAVAQSGLSRYFSTVNGKPGATQDLTFNDLPGGTAQVSLRMLRESTTTLLPAVYVVHSRGTHTAAKRFSVLTPPAERSVASYALWTPTPFDLNAALTSLVGVSSNGTAGAYSGIDRCGAAAAIPGVGVPNNSDAFTHPEIINGNPEDVALDMGTPGPSGTAQDEVNIDWAGIVAGTAFPADYVYPAWPTSTQFNDWPVTRVDGDLTMPTSGKGILVVTGNLTWNGTPNKMWEGLILVGGTLVGNGQSTIYGSVITGLNVKLGIAVPDYDVGNGTKTWQYDSCSLARALGRIGSLQRMRNGWTDTWSSY